MNFMTRIATTCLISIVALGLGGAACEKKPETKPDQPVVSDVADLQEPKEEPTSGLTHELVVPQDVGPAAPAIFFMTGLKGYTEPCGCTLDVMLGGIDRIVRYRDEAAALVEASVLVDGGDVLFEHKTYEEEQIPQERARVEVIVAGLKRLKPIFTVPGPRDFALGAEFYAEKMAEAGVLPRAINMEINGKALDGPLIHTLGSQRVALVPVVQPSLFEGIANVKTREVQDTLPAVLKTLASEELTATILVAHGDLAFVKATLQANPQFQFGLVGHDPRETDQADAVNTAFTLEPYDQGRYFGILKLYPAKDSPNFVNARSGSKTEIEAIDTQIAHVNSSIEKIPPATPGQEPPMLLNLRKRLADLETRKRQIKNATITVSPEQSAFLWQSVPMLPGLRVDAKMEEVRGQYNRSLKELNLAVTREIPPVEPGKPEYIGSSQCATCHLPAHDFWKATPHGRALDTLVKRDKDFDHTCVGCHVVGYEKPGGSVLGQLSYTREVASQDGAIKMEITKDLQHVGCESCHGPGSFHRFQPVGADGPQHILRKPTVDTCMECHVPEHSPRFNFDTYVRQITGEGHVLSNP